MCACLPLSPEQFHLETLTIHTLGFNQNDYTFSLILLIKIILRSKFPETKFINCKCFDIKFHVQPEHVQPMRDTRSRTGPPALRAGSHLLFQVLGDRGNPAPCGTNQGDFIRTSIPEEYDFLQGIGAFPSPIRLTALIPWAGIVFLRNTRRD